MVQLLGVATFIVPPLAGLYLVGMVLLFPGILVAIYELSERPDLHNLFAVFIGFMLNLSLWLTFARPRIISAEARSARRDDDENDRT